LEDKKIIQSYNDKSEDDNFKLEVTIPSKMLAEWDEDTLLSKLKLIKRVTENYTVLDENNKIAVFDDIQSILNKYISVKKHYLDLRKANLISELTESIRYDFSKYTFIKKIVSNELTINNRQKNDVVNDMKSIPNILEKDGSYDYLLNMGIMSLTEERVKKLEQEIKNKKNELDSLQKRTIENIWESEL